MNPIPENDGLDDIRKLAQAVELALKSNPERRFIDIDRIPLICLSITGIHGTLERIEAMIKEERQQSEEVHKTFITKDSFEQQFWPVRTIVYGMVGIILVAAIGALVALVVHT